MAWTAGQILTAAQLNTYLPQAVDTWTSPISSGITVGSGTTVAVYNLLGPLVFCRFRFVMGAGSAITGNVVLTLPVTAAATDGSVEGMVEFDDSGTTTYPGQVVQASTNSVTVKCFNAAATNAVLSTLSATNPFTWATNDQIKTSFWYQAA